MAAGACPRQARRSAWLRPVPRARGPRPSRTRRAPPAPGAHCSTNPGRSRRPVARRSLRRPWLECAFVEYLDLLLHRFELAAAERQQLGAALVAGEHLLQWQLARLDESDQLLELFEGGLVAGWGLE